MLTVLWGDEHIMPGEVHVEPAGEYIAVGITQGWRPKSYRYTDPNEDAVAAVVGQDATLLVVADGHNGFDASRAAVAMVLESFGEDPPTDALPHELAAVFHASAQAVLDATARLAGVRRESRTTLTVALLAGRRLRWASLGDSTLIVAGGGGAAELAVPGPFLGYPMAPRHVHHRLGRGLTELADDDWLVLVTDGFTNHLPAPGPPAEVVRERLASVTSPTDAVHAIMDAARAGGAGDNVAVAVAAPPAASDRVSQESQ